MCLYARLSCLSGLLFCVSLAVSAGAAEPSVPPPEKPKTVADKSKTEGAAKPDQEIVVTASQVATPRESTGVSTSIVSAQQVQATQKTEAADLLRSVPGVTVNQSGREGDLAMIYIRGGNSDQSLVLYDGWKVNRHGGGTFFNLESLDPVALDRIEVARGPSSSVFGSEAVTGAVNVITAKGEGKPEITASGAAGTYDTTRQTAGVQGSQDKFSYNAQSSHLHRGGTDVPNSEVESYNYAARFDFDVNADQHLKLVTRGSDFRKGWYEDTATGWGVPTAPADPNDTIKNAEWLVGLEYTGRIFPIWETVVRAGHHGLDLSNISREPNPFDPQVFLSQTPSTQTAGERTYMYEWRNNVTAFETKQIKDIVTVGVYAEDQGFREVDDNPFFGNNISREQTNYSFYYQNRLELYQRAFVTLGGRHEQNAQFGAFDTARADVSILIPESDTRVFGSVGNAFRAPSFFELYSPLSGSPDLKPERNLAYDMGIEQNFWKKRINLSATYFHNSFNDLITFEYVFPTYRSVNLNRAETHGFEYQAAIHPLRQLSLDASATQLHTEGQDGLEMRRLLRRPVHTQSGRLTVHPLVGWVEEKWAGLDLCAEVLHVSTRTDFGPTELNPFGERVRNPGYVRPDLAVSYRFYDHFRAFARFQNFTDEKYEDVRTFPADRANILGGLEFRWRF